MTLLGTRIPHHGGTTIFGLCHSCHLTLFSVHPWPSVGFPHRKGALSTPFTDHHFSALQRVTFPESQNSLQYRGKALWSEVSCRRYQVLPPQRPHLLRCISSGRRCSDETAYRHYKPSRENPKANFVGVVVGRGLLGSCLVVVW